MVSTNIFSLPHSTLRLSSDHSQCAIYAYSDWGIFLTNRKK